MFFPNYRIEIGRETFTSDSQVVISFNVKLGLGPKVDSFEVVFAKDDRTSTITRNDIVKVDLGYEEKLITIFSGAVNTVDHGFLNVKVFCLGFALNLVGMRFNKVYVNQTAGQIVSDLISSTKERLGGTPLIIVGLGEIMDGFTYPVYVVDERLCIYENIERLASRSNYVFYTSADNKLFFKKYEKKEEQVFKYGENLIDVKFEKMVAPYNVTVVHGEGSSSWTGRETWHWLVKGEVVGVDDQRFSEGGKDISGSHHIFIYDYAIKDNETVGEVTKNVSSRLNRATKVTLKVLGAPEVRVNDTVRVEGLSESSFDSPFQVIEVEHYLNKVDGFGSFITCVPVEG